MAPSALHAERPSQTNGLGANGGKERLSFRP